MIRAHNGKHIVLCDGCDFDTVVVRDEAAAPFELRRRGWVVNTASRGWRHFCASCAVEFSAGETRSSPF